MSKFWGQPEPRKSQQQLKQEMDAMKQQLNALECVGRGEYDAAIATFTEAFACQSLGAELLYNYRGDCYQQLDRHPLAIKDYTSYLKFHPKDRDAYTARALSYREVDHFALELEDLERVKDLLHRQKKLSEDERQLLAEVVYDIERSRIETEHHNKLGELQGEMENMLDQARKANPKYSRHDPLYNIPKKIYHSASEKSVKKGMELDNAGEFIFALEYYDYAIEVNPAAPTALNCRAFCLQSLEYYLDAIDDFSQALLWAPDDPNLHFGLGSCCAAIKKYDLAVLHGDRAVSWAAAKNPRYAAYEQLATERGYKDAGELYDMMTMGWRVSDNGPKDVLSNIQSPHAHVQDFIRDQRAKEDRRMDHLFRRRNR